MRMLVIAAHPDDEVLGCGGYIAGNAAQNEVFTALVTEGCSARYKGRDAKEIIKQKKNPAFEAGRLSGVKSDIYGDFEDIRPDTVSHVDLNLFLSNTIREKRPDLVLTYQQGDVNQDHRLRPVDFGLRL